VNRARSLRKRATECERILWRHLRNRNFAGYKFRRQHPIDPYTLDFYCPTAKLAIELDGGGHNYRDGQMRDQRREKFLANQGIAVVRFWNHQVREELDSVLQAIWFALEEKTGRDPLPQSSPFVKGRGKLHQDAQTKLPRIATSAFEPDLLPPRSEAPLPLVKGRGLR
jgi:very-short-patch-repair endonuclease